MAGRRRSRPRHARPSALRSLALLVAGGMVALFSALLLNNLPAGAEASTSTATLTLLGIRDSNCDFQTGGTTVYIKPGGTVTFTGELTGISVKVAGLTIPISSSLVTSFNYKLIINGDKKHPHLVNGKSKYVLRDVTKDQALAWSAASVQINVPLLGGLHKLENIPLSLSNVTGIPAGGHLNWAGKVVASSNTKCGIAQVPGGVVSVGPIHVTVPPITNLPSQPGLPNLPGGGNSSSSSSGHHPGNGHGSSPGTGGGSNPSGSQTPIPELVVPNVGSGGDSAFGGGGIGGLGAQPDAGGIGPAAADAVTSTAAAPSSAPGSKPKPVDLATNSTDGGLGGPQLPVLLAIVAIIALSLVTAAYARMYLLRRQP